MPTVLGVDGCRGGWIAAIHDLRSHRCTVALYASFAELVAAHADAAVIATDIPIGLSDAAPRVADVEARRFLGRRGSSVFPAPCRAALDAPSYAEACARSQAASGKKISKQTDAIRGKIREVDVLLRSDPSLRTRVVEVHPEVSFAVLNDDLPMLHVKKRAEGQRERLAVLPAMSRAAFAEARARWLRRTVATDDILDALVAMWSAERVHAGTARSFPPPPLRLDSVGLPLRILA